MTEVTQTQTQTVTTKDGKSALAQNLRSAIRQGLHEAKEKHLDEAMTAMTIEGKIRDLIVYVFPQHHDKVQEMMMDWFTKVSGT